MNKSRAKFVRALAVAAAVALAPLSPARADLALSNLVIDLQPGRQDRHDIEVSNTGPDRAFVAIEPKEVLNPGTADERRLENRDPEQLGLLVSPARMVLEPGQRKLLRIASIAAPGATERVYRIRVVPAVGQLSSDHSGLKVLVGYEALVLVRPTDPQPKLVGTRSGDKLTIRNHGNASVELTDGTQCDTSGKNCSPLPSGRLYAGAEKVFTVKPTHAAQYTARFAGKTLTLRF